MFLNRTRSPRPGAAGFVVVAVLALAACSTTAPPPTPEIRAIGAPFRQAPVAGNEALDAATWRGFGDPLLDDLLARARAANLDVRIAAQRATRTVDQHQAVGCLAQRDGRLAGEFGQDGAVSDACRADRCRGRHTAAHGNCRRIQSTTAGTAGSWATLVNSVGSPPRTRSAS